ncbi:Exonuclease III [Saccharicrinis carchari]|uniref:Exonuclease III n=1 Tax=Saccharicrinis carchari TaxID=1168039 RepID=A0A521BZ53_SACCC|nr:endonuclease/exonuclease/phosphatase family protein [Saccharicrinis carchari]SMO52335.1 Exonuclease III [Saccharicrinis carchari]
MKKAVYCILLFQFLVFYGLDAKNLHLKVLQFNIWQEGTVVPGGFDAIIDEIIRTEADLVALSEVRNYNNTSLDERMVKALAAKGHTFYARRGQDTGLLSRFPILSQEALFPVKNDQGSVTKAIIKVKGVEVAFYSAHLDYRNCSLYLPRGYDGSTWAKLPAPITDTAIIAADNLKSMRDEAIDTFIADALQEISNGREVIFGGDFNEPSHLDWIEANKNLYDRNGVVMPWRNTLALSKAGFTDVYREIFPNPLTHPGFTFPADNILVPIDKLAWAPDADDRDRIDFIFYYPGQRLKLKDVKIIGPIGSVVRNKRQPETSDDPIEEPPGIWPTDHKAVLAMFVLRVQG